MTAPRPRRGPTVLAVAAALRTLPKGKADAGAVALARRYAELIDEAAPRATYRGHLDALAEALHELGEHNPKAAESAGHHLIKVATALSAHTVASDLGPKLLAVLDRLGLTPAGRGVKGAMASGVGKGRDEVAEQRRRRASRTQRAAGEATGEH